jgi:hypothetical protein
VSQRLLRLEVPVFPERRMFRVHDTGVDPDAPGGPLPPVGTLVSMNRDQLWVGSLQEHVEVKLVLEEWHGAPAPCGDGWDEEAKGQLYVRGMLSVDEGSRGRVVDGLRLAGGVGDYSVRVYARNREQVMSLYHELFDTWGDPLSDDFQRARRNLENLEQYLIQLWRQS